ncbi:MAG: phosphate/phosphite/phosphonate ABC transporter substrate-binding protein [Ignavibacteriaceae bacterium]|nr:phosphate/phosphite/phosphonate ABC transporter substrate-binding protein [Ignavibacteriaceae bacterium]
MRFIKYLFLLSPLIIFVVISTAKESGKYSQPLGSKINPIKIFFTPSVDANQITSTADELVKFLEKETGYYFVTAVPADYVTVVESFGSSKADVAIINTFSYLLANQKFGTSAKLRIVRDGGETFYRGCFLVRSNSGIDSIQQLSGKRIAYVDASSTSGYILPKALLTKENIKTSDEVMAKKHDNVVTMVYQGQVDAGATYYSPTDENGFPRDARERVVTQYPDVFQKIKVIALTEQIPNDPVIFRAGLPKEMTEKLVDALLKFVSTPSGQEALYRIYNVKQLIRTEDSDYDVLRDILKRINFKLEAN